MPPKVKVTKEEIVRAALDLVRQSGAAALNARAVANRLGCSTQPVFSNYATMEELRQDVLQAADGCYQKHIAEGMRDRAPGCPPYKASGMAYISFARREKELFKLLFMRDRTGEKIEEDRRSVAPLLRLISANTGMSEDDAYFFHLEMWIYVHGIATMIATGYLNWDEEQIGRMMADAYEGIRSRRAGGS